ncbi:hypothetical protein HPB48_010069 [Haemaphysalis longicornis]|uniref:Uncharacterized protein n=1 Tax=Haemaphysalis longicornis TaxID=44386 RepID=A0A9J6GA33_HAELO|nr:hypothetical protein HPB48_010069 [Haemaphysalis longicornis]
MIQIHRFPTPVLGPRKAANRSDAPPTSALGTVASVIEITSAGLRVDSLEPGHPIAQEVGNTCAGANRSGGADFPMLGGGSDARDRGDSEGRLDSMDRSTASAHRGNQAMNMPLRDLVNKITVQVQWTQNLLVVSTAHEELINQLTAIRQLQIAIPLKVGDQKKLEVQVVSILRRDCSRGDEQNTNKVVFSDKHFPPLSSATSCTANYIKGGKDTRDWLAPFAALRRTMEENTRTTKELIKENVTTRKHLEVIMKDIQQIKIEKARQDKEIPQMKQDQAQTKQCHAEFQQAALETFQNIQTQIQGINESLKQTHKTQQKIQETLAAIVTKISELDKE